ncbi:MAG TPA: GTPase HflX [Bacillota bacterium]
MVIDLNRPDDWPLEHRCREFVELARTAGAEAVDVVVQRRRQPDPVYLIGRGKVADLAERVRRTAADLVIVEHDLSPGQARHLEDALEVGVLDRTQLILDIFAQRARTREGQLQVELAQLRYLLPRLAGKGTQLSRLGGGIGTRGPGETKLETDRRRMRRRIRDLVHELEEVRRHRRVLRRGRSRGPRPVIALVGYTNAGKSSMLQALTGSEARAEDRLFATLDPLSRLLILPGGTEAILIDTVGFIHNLPPQLVAAFSATLEEVVEADLLLHVVDASHPLAAEMADTVTGILRRLGAGDKPVVIALNKSDLVSQPPALPRMEAEAVVPTSAVTGQGLDALRAALAEVLNRQRRRLCLRIPYDRMEVLDLIHRSGQVTRTRYLESGIEVEAEVDPAAAGRIEARLDPTVSP